MLVDMGAVLPCLDHAIALSGADAQLLLLTRMSVLSWRLTSMILFFHVGVGVVSAAMLWPRTRFLTELPMQLLCLNAIPAWVWLSACIAVIMYGCSLSVEDALTEPRGLIVPSVPTLIYGGRGMMASNTTGRASGRPVFAARHTFYGGREPHCRTTI